MSWTLLVALAVGDPFMVEDFKTAEACHAAGRQVLTLLKTATPVDRTMYEEIRSRRVIRMPALVLPLSGAASSAVATRPPFVKRYDCLDESTER